MSSERRKFPRVPVTQLKVIWRTTDTLDNLTPAKNISAKGICLLTGDEQPKIGDILAVEYFIPPSEKASYVKAKIVWVKEATKEAGIEFIDLAISAFNELQKFILSRM